jgi:hypothetical protein
MTSAVGVMKMSCEQIFDTLKYANKLKAVGVPEKQAEVQVEMLAEIMDDKLATKADIKHLEERLENRIDSLELRIILKLGSLMIGSLGTLVVLMKLFKL